MTLLLCAVLGNAWGESTTYTFTSKSWAATSGGNSANWTSGKDGNQMQSGRGVQVTTGATGANATSPVSFDNVTKIEVTYSTNASSGAGTIKVQVGSNSVKSFTVTKPSSGGTTDKTATFDFTTAETGNVKLTVDCSTNSIYIKDITITTGAALPTPTLTLNPSDTDIEVAKGVTTTFSVSSNYTDGDITCSSNNTSIASVTGTGSNGSFTFTITGVAPGSATITVSQEGTNNHKPATVSIEVEVYDPRELANLIVSPTTVVVFVDENKSVNIDSDSDGEISFSGYDDDVATIEGSNGSYTITGVSVGTTTITVNQAETTEYQSGTATINVTVNRNSYATLPFSFTGGRSDIASTDGLSQSGLGTDYGDATCKLRIDNTGDYVILHFNETPGELSFNIKSNSFSGGQFTVQTSTDGITYTNLKTYTSDDNISAADNGQSEKFNLAADVRYIKWIYTNKVSGNIGLGNIKVEKPAKPSAGLAFTPTEVTVNLGESFTQPTLTNDYNVTVTYTSSNESVATVDSSDGTVAILGAGVTTITASFAGNDTYAAGSASYTLTVVDPNAKGTINNPYTVAEAIEFIATLGSSISDAVYVKGIISQIDNVYVNGTAQYWISDDGTTTTQLEIYSGKSLGGNYFQAENEICVDDHVVVYGRLKLYNNSVNEFDSGSEINSLARDRYYVAGSWTDWQNSKIEMAKSQDGKSYTLDGQELQEGAQFKIIKVAYDNVDNLIWYGGTANGSYWVTLDNHENIPLTIDGNGVVNFYMPQAGTWDFTVTFNNGAPQLTVDGSWPQASYYLMGDFNSWTISDDYKFAEDETTGKYTFSATIEQGQHFKILKSYDQTVDNDDIWYGAVSNGDFDFLEQYVDVELSLTSPGENYLMTLSNPLTWNLSFDPSINKLVLSNYYHTAAVYQKVTSADQIVAGKEYILVGQDPGARYYAMGEQHDNPSSSTSTNYREAISVPNPVDDKITITNENIVSLTLDGQEDAWTFLASDGYYLKADNGNYLNPSTTIDSYCKWKITESFTVTSARYDGRTIRFNSSNQKRFACYGSNSQVQDAYLYVKEDDAPSFEFTIRDNATDGEGHYYATIASLGEGNFKVTGNVEVHTVIVEKGIINYEETWYPGQIFPGNGAYLVEGPKGKYLFPETSEEPTYPVGENMLRSTGEKAVDEDYAITAEEMKEGNDGDNMYYKLSLRNGKIGFYWGTEGGGAFNYSTPHQAYLVVPVSETPSANANAIYFDGTTGIEAVKDAKTTTGTVHTLSGIRVDAKQLPKGIYIVDGKKIVVK